MAGTVYGKVDCNSNLYVGEARGSAQDAHHCANEIYTGFYAFMQTLQSNGITELVAMNTGSSPGNGVGYWNEATKFGPNAFSVWRWKANANRPWDWYMYIHCLSGSTTSSNTPNSVPTRFGASPSSTNGSTVVDAAEAHVLVQCAIGVSNNGQTSYNPWNGTTNTSGAAFKGYPVWSTGSSTTNSLFVFPRENNPGGSTLANAEKSFCSDIFKTLEQSTYAALRGVRARYHFLADSDSMVFFVQAARSYNFLANYFKIQGLYHIYVPHYFGSFNLLNSLVEANTNNVLGGTGSLGFLMLASWPTQETAFSNGSATPTTFKSTIPINRTCGYTSTTEATGGVLATLTPGVVNFSLQIDNGNSTSPFRSSFQHMNNLLNRGTSSFVEEYPIRVLADEGRNSGPLGWIDSPLLRFLFNGQNYQVSQDGKRAIFGGINDVYYNNANTTVYSKITTCWSGSNPPGTIMSRSGSTFTLTNP